VAWGTIKLVSTRKDGPGEEDTWTFGQILPLALLAAPVVGVIEHFTDEPGHSNRDLTPHNAPTSTTASAQDISLQLALSNAGCTGQEYERTNTFRGLLILATVTYIECGVFILVRGRGIVQPLAALAFASLMFNPFLQLLWALAILWTKKLDLGALLRSLQFGISLFFSCS
jgi:hypothetical protein